MSSSTSPRGKNIPLKAAFIGIKGLPLVAIATNNATPKLRLFDDHLEFKVLKTQNKSWSEIAQVDAPTGRGGPFLLFVWTSGVWTFSAHFASEVARLQTLRFLQEKQVPLSPVALALL